MDIKTAPFVFVVDTDSYAGNFERELVGYMTGTDNGTHGDEEAEQFKKAFPKEAQKFQAIVLELLDEDRYISVAHIYPTPGRFNDGWGTSWHEAADMGLVKAKRDKQIRINNSRLDEESIKKRLKEPVKKHPAFESVAVAFSEKPSESQIVLMKNRARDFEAKTKEFSIKGFRLIENKTVIKTTSRSV